MRFRRPSTSALLMTAALALSAPLARGADGEQNQAAVDLAYEGKERFESGDYATALDRFQRAQAMAGSPVFDLYIARSLKALGRWREALVAYEETTQYQIDEGNVSFRQAQENAARELRELRAKMPKLSVTAPHSATTAAPTLLIDGEQASWPVRSLAIDPGKHVVSATLGDETHDEVVTLAAGQSLEIQLPFGKQPSPASPSDATPADGPREKRGLSPLAWTAFGISAAGLVVGATTGTWAAVNMSSLNSHCAEAGDPCPEGIPEDPTYRSMRDTTATLATTADVAFIVAGASAVLGLTFALTLGRREKAEPARASLELRPAGTGLLLAGSF